MATVGSEAPKQKEIAEYIHDSCDDIKGVHLSCCGFPFIEFDRVLAVGDQDYLPRPSLLVA